MQQLRGQPEAGFTGAGRPYHTAIQVAGVGRIFRPGVHGQKFRPGQNDVILKNRVYKGFDVLCRSPAG